MPSASLPGPRTPSPWTIVVQAGATLATGMGIGRFVFTPIPPLMHAQAGLSSGLGADLATANFIGYLAGAVLRIAVPAALRVPLLRLLTTGYRVGQLLAALLAAYAAFAVCVRFPHRRSPATSTG